VNLIRAARSAGGLLLRPVRRQGAHVSDVLTKNCPGILFSAPSSVCPLPSSDGKAGWRTPPAGLRSGDSPRASPCLTDLRGIVNHRTGHAQCGTCRLVFSCCFCAAPGTRGRSPAPSRVTRIITIMPASCSLRITASNSWKSRACHRQEPAPCAWGARARAVPDILIESASALPHAA